MFEITITLQYGSRPILVRGKEPLFHADGSLIIECKTVTRFAAGAWMICGYEKIEDEKK